MAIEKRFNKHEREILRTLYSERRPMSLRELSDKADVSWVTAKKYTDNLNEKGIITFDNAKNKKVKFNFNIFS
jgi:predicted ArsR family transcriptional regulator